MSKPKKTSLSPPRLQACLKDCLSCGYPLEGIPVPGQCPECGLKIYPGRSTLCISGVAKGTPGPMWRKIVWVCIGLFGFLYSQLWVIALTEGMGWFTGIGFVMLLASISAMVVTSKQKSRGSEQFAFTREGFSRSTVGSPPTARIFIEWDGVKRAAVIKRVGSVWASLKIVTVDQDGKHTTPLETGFRCAQEDIGIIQEVVDALLDGRDLEAIESLESSAFSAIEPGEDSL